MKKLVSLILIVLFAQAVQSPQTALALAFPDVSTEHINHTAIAWLSKEGIIQGYPDGTFKPDNPINRAELLKIIVMMKAAVDSNYQNCFPDVTDEWYAKYVCYALEKEWIKGYPDGFFKPSNNVNRVEAIKIILNALIPHDEWPELTTIEKSYLLPADFDPVAWYIDYARIALVKDYVDRSHTTPNQDRNINYYPGGDMTRKEVAEMIYRIKKQ